MVTGNETSQLFHSVEFSLLSKERTELDITSLMTKERKWYYSICEKATIAKYLLQPKKM